MSLTPSVSEAEEHLQRILKGWRSRYKYIILLKHADKRVVSGRTADGHERADGLSEHPRASAAAADGIDLPHIRRAACRSPPLPPCMSSV